MATDAEYQAKIAQYTWDALERLWQHIQQKTTTDWESGKALEYLILRAFQLESADIRWPYSVRFQGEEVEQIDGVVYLGELACLIECKDYHDTHGQTKNINFEPIAKMRSQLMRRPSATIGCVFSSGGFTEPAKILADFTFPQTILLWNGGEIDYGLRTRTFRQGLLTKYRKCIEYSIHDYDITTEEVL